jgi:hypothetical protein
MLPNMQKWQKNILTLLQKGRVTFKASGSNEIFHGSMMQIILTGKRHLVMAVAYVPDYSQAAFACMVWPEQDCTHYLRLPFLMMRKHSFREEKLQKVLLINGIRKRLWENFVMPTAFHHQSWWSIGSHCPQPCVADTLMYAVLFLSDSSQGTQQ